jgi:hypothetical protein
MNRLCALIQVEKDPHRFSHLVQQLNELFERKEEAPRNVGTSSILATHFSDTTCRE